MKFNWEAVFSLERVVAAGLKVGTILVLAFVTYEVGKWLINRLLRLTVPPKRITTLATLLRNVLKYFVFFVALAMILREIGVDPVSLIAGAGIIGFALGFGAQSLVKDIVSGFFILFEGVFAIGDFVCLHCAGAPDVFGLVEEIGLRATKVRDISGAVSAVPNGLITSVDGYPLGYIPYFLSLVMPAELGRENVKKWLDGLLADMSKLSGIIAEEPRLAEGVDLSDGKIMARVKLGLIPSAEEMEALVEYVKGSFQDRFNAEIPVITYRLSEGAYEKYKKLFATSHPLA